MASLRRPPVVLALAFAALIAFTGCGSLFRTAAAIVNGHTISDDEVRRELNLALADPTSSARLGVGNIREERIREATRQLLSILIQQELIREYAIEHDVSVDPATLDAAVSEAVQGAGGQDAFLAVLRARDLTIGDVRDNIERTMLAQLVQLRVVSEAVSEAELRAEYEQRKAEFAEAHLRHILLATLEDGRRIAARATAGNFERLAVTRSLDTATASQGGDLGTVTLATLAKPFAQAVLDTDAGQVGGPIETDQGIEVFLVVSKRVTPFAEAKQQLLTERQTDVFDQWLRGRIAEAVVRVNPRYGRLDKTTGQIVPVTSTGPTAIRVQLTP